MTKKIAVFLDRDGTINKEGGYINHESRLELMPNSSKGIKLFNENNILTVVCTNQAGVARGYFKENLIQVVNQRLQNLLKKEGAYLDDINYCPHHPTVGSPDYQKDCNCRKPKPGMIEKSAKKLDIDIKKSYVVGDKMSDVIWGHKMGTKSVMVMTGYGRGEYEYHRESWHDKPDYIAQDLLGAAKWIIKDIKKTL
ncbi:MAG: HAD family hydrolase [bacterium]|nr:HAD family hydrolase [bacterium]